MPRFFRLLLVIATLHASASSAHEFWIEAESPSSAHIRVGQMLVGEMLPYVDRIIRSARHRGPGGEVQLAGRQGDIPALAYDASAQGMHLFAVETEPAYIVFRDMVEFGEYLSYEGLQPIHTLHQKLGLPAEEIAEEYYRYARMLVQVGASTAQDADAPLGLRHELVAVTSPFATEDGTIVVQLLWDGAPNPDVQLAVFHRAASDGKVTRKLLRSDAEGKATADVSSAGLYVINAVEMLPADGPGSVVWQSHWASLSFTLMSGETKE